MRKTKYCLINKMSFCCKCNIYFDRFPHACQQLSKVMGENSSNNIRLYSPIGGLSTLSVPSYPKLLIATVPSSFSIIASC